MDLGRLDQTSSSDDLRNAAMIRITGSNVRYFQLNNLDLIHSDTVKNSITGEHGNSDDKHLIFGNVATMLKIESLPFNFSNSADFLAILKYYDEDESEDLKNEEIG